MTSDLDLDLGFFIGGFFFSDEIKALYILCK